MSVKHAILGLVIERPGDPPDLEQRCHARMPTGGIESLEVNCALAALLREGSISSTGEIGATRSEARPVYEATPTGRERFEEWFNSPPTHSTAIREAVLKIGAGGPADVDRLIELTLEYELAGLDRLSQLGEGETFPEVIERIGIWQTVQNGIGQDAEEAQIRTLLEWLSNTRDWLKWAKKQMREDQLAGRREGSERD